jgi:hypothetical protein
MSNFIRELDWDTVQEWDVIQVVNGQSNLQGVVVGPPGGLRLQLPLPYGPTTLDTLRASGYALYVNRPEVYVPSEDPEVELRNAQLAPYTRPKLPIEKTPWSPGQIGFVAVLVIAAVVMIAFMVIRR